MNKKMLQLAKKKTKEKKEKKKKLREKKRAKSKPTTISRQLNHPNDLIVIVTKIVNKTPKKDQSKRNDRN